ncbi:MAG: PocR ligand-binding domain-containing protein [Chloroflexi bacterium]|nr:PocR ligand-binding domain-containing protein [Chloroflexota bacterium]
MDDLLTTKQLMGLLSVDRTTIYRMLNDGRLPAVRVGGQWRFPRQAIEKWLGEQQEPAATDSGASIAPPTTPHATIEVLPVYCLQPIQEVFAQTSDVGAITTDLNGKPLTPVSNSCAMCNLILATEKGRARCAASWEKLADQAEKQPRLEKCHAGLTYARGRIVVQDEFIAMFFVGQFVVDDPKPLRAKTHLAQVARACDVDPKELTRAAQNIRVLEKTRAERLLHLLQMVADTYSHIGEERLDLVTRLKKVAEIAGVSTG